MEFFEPHFSVLFLLICCLFKDIRNLYISGLSCLRSIECIPVSYTHLYEDQPAYVPYCRLTNGKTRDAKEVLGTDQYPYLKSVDCAADKNAEDAFQSKEIDGTGYEITKQDSAGYVLEVKQGENVIDGDTFRNQWELPSSCYTMRQTDKKTTVITQGIGHGLGLSQNMAEELRCV